MSNKLRLKEMDKRQLRKLAKGLGRQCSDYSRENGMLLESEVKLNQRIAELEHALDALGNTPKAREGYTYIGEIPNELLMGVDGQLKTEEEEAQEHAEWVAREVARVQREDGYEYPEWHEGAEYKEGQIVQYKGRHYSCTEDDNNSLANPFISDFWMMLAEPRPSTELTDPNMKEAYEQWRDAYEKEEIAAAMESHRFQSGTVVRQYEHESGTGLITECTYPDGQVIAHNWSYPKLATDDEAHYRMKVTDEGVFVPTTDGTIEDVIVSDRVLTPDEVAVEWAKRNGHHFPNGRPGGDRSSEVSVTHPEVISQENRERHSTMEIQDSQVYCRGCESILVPTDAEHEIEGKKGWYCISCQERHYVGNPH